MRIHFRDTISILSLEISFLLITGPIFGENAKLKRPKQRGRTVAHQELDTRYAETKKKIILIHNFYRARVEPPAKNMLEMTWHKGAEETAQKWANMCYRNTYAKPLARWVDDYGSCGQNIYVSDVRVDWMFVAKAWYMESENYQYGKSENNLTSVRHYTQMIWYNSHRIGCAFKICGKSEKVSPFFNYVCNYCPIGNVPNQLTKPYATGKPCENCKKNCKYKKLCTNSCSTADLWVNCMEINSLWHKWLCDESPVRRKGCQATCDCPHAIK